MKKHWIFDARIIRGRHSGIARYTSSIIIGLINSPHLYDRLTIILEKDYNYSENEGYQLIDKKLHQGIEIVKLKAPPFSWRHHYIVSKFVNQQKSALYFYPHFDVPFWIRIPTTFVIHDLFAFYVPRYFGWRNSLMKLYYKLTITKTLKRQYSQLITVSNASKTCIKEVFGEKITSRVKVVYETSPISLDSIARQAPNYNLTTPFLLYVGSRRPNKNLGYIVEVFKTLKEVYNYPGKLIMACGTKNWNYDLDKAIHEYSYIELLDELSDQELSTLYQQMDGLFYPSVFEGFGLPIVEAAGFGKKVITSNRNSMKEISPDWALLVDPTTQDYNSIARQISVYLNKDLDIHPDKYRFYQLSWEQIAEQTFGPQNSQ